MRALILNSGTGSRMKSLTADNPKCMTELITGQTIITRQIEQLESQGIREIIITTGPFAEMLKRHSHKSAHSASLLFVNNPDYLSTNYIYSIYLAKELVYDDIVLMHGDLVFTTDILQDIMCMSNSAAVISSTLPLPQKDFKAVITNGLISAVGIEFFTNAVAMQPLYKLNKDDWLIWLTAIEAFIAKGEKKCYAENAFNAVSQNCAVYPFDVKERLCAEIDTPDDLDNINTILARGNLK